MEYYFEDQYSRFVRTNIKAPDWFLNDLRYHNKKKLWCIIKSLANLQILMINF